MAGKWETFRAWARLIAALASCAAVLLIIIMNRNNRTDLWLFHTFQQVSVLWLIAVTAATTLLLYLVARGVRSALKRVKTNRHK